MIYGHRKCITPPCIEGERYRCRMIPKDPKAEFTVRASALSGEGIPDFLKAVETVLGEGKVLFEIELPFSRAGEIQAIRKYGQLIREEYTENGIFIRAKAPARVRDRLISLEAESDQ